jgi:predicted ArsR family transcriptional regulator
VDRLALFKVLADGSRYAVYQEVARGGEPLSTTAIAARLQLHPNTVRLHLEKLREAGLLEVSADRHGSVGRPQHRWAVVAQAPSLGLEPAGFRLLAHLLAEVAAQHSAEAPVSSVSSVSTGQSGAADVGRRHGLASSSTHPAGTGTPTVACLRAVMDELADLGFDPSLDDGPDLDQDLAHGLAGISFTRCPFRELAVLYPDLVCELHRGITEGLLSGAVAANPGAAARLKSFSSLVDPDPCRVEVSLSLG